MIVIDTVDNLQVKSYLSCTQQQQSRHSLPEVDSDEEADFVAQHVSYSINKEKEYRRRIAFLCSVIQPLLEGYAACGACLPGLVGQQVTEKQLIERVTSECDSQLRRGFAIFGMFDCFQLFLVPLYINFRNLVSVDRNL